MFHFDAKKRKGDDLNPGFNKKSKEEDNDLPSFTNTNIDSNNSIFQIPTQARIAITLSQKSVFDHLQTQLVLGNVNDIKSYLDICASQDPNDPSADNLAISLLIHNGMKISDDQSSKQYCLTLYHIHTRKTLGFVIFQLKNSTEAEVLNIMVNTKLDENSLIRFLLLIETVEQINKLGYLKILLNYHLTLYDDLYSKNIGQLEHIKFKDPEQQADQKEQENNKKKKKYAIYFIDEAHKKFKEKTHKELLEKPVSYPVNKGLEIEPINLGSLNNFNLANKTRIGDCLNLTKEFSVLEQLGLQLISPTYNQLLVLDLYLKKSIDAPYVKALVNDQNPYFENDNQFFILALQHKITGEMFAAVYYSYNKTENVGMIDSLVVHEKCRKKYYGSLMLLATLKHFINLGCNKVELQSTSEGLSLYLKFPFILSDLEVVNAPKHLYEKDEDSDKEEDEDREIEISEAQWNALSFEDKLALVRAQPRYYELSIDLDEENLVILNSLKIAIEKKMQLLLPQSSVTHETGPLLPNLKSEDTPPLPLSNPSMRPRW